MELDDKVYEQIVELCEEGDAFVEGEQYEEAIEKYIIALDLLPLPRKDWEASTWIYTAIGDTYYITCEYVKAKQYFYDALNCPDALANPFILLRLGESLYECEEYDEAQEYLLKAFMMEGYKIFYEEDDKYFDLIKDNI